MSARVLVLDDDVLVAKALGRILNRANYEAVLASTPEEALAHLSTGTIAVIISDQAMPLCTGVDFLERCAGEFPLISQLLLTGHADVAMAAAAIQRTEAMRLLFKPWNEVELLQAVGEAVWKHVLVADVPLRMDA